MILPHRQMGVYETVEGLRSAPVGAKRTSTGRPAPDASRASGCPQDKELTNFTMEDRYTMKEERPRSYEELPLVLDMKDIQHILGISRTTAYKLIHEDDFPMFHSGNRIKVSKQALFDWMAGRK